MYVYMVSPVETVRCGGYAIATVAETSELSMTLFPRQCGLYNYAVKNYIV